MKELLIEHISKFTTKGDLLLAFMGLIFLIIIFIIGDIAEKEEKKLNL